MDQSVTPDVSASDGEMTRLKRLFERNPTSTIFARLADAYLSLGEVEEAVRVCRRGLKYRPSYVTGHIVLGRSLIRQGDFAAAEDEFQKVLTLEPDHLAAIQYLGTIAARHGDLDRSGRLRQRLGALNPFLVLSLECETRTVQASDPASGAPPERVLAGLEVPAAVDVLPAAAADVPAAAAIAPASAELPDTEQAGVAESVSAQEADPETSEFPFVSLTLARLYARQGHRGQAERVVRLVSPADADDILSRISQESAK